MLDFLRDPELIASVFNELQARKLFKNDCASVDQLCHQLLIWRNSHWNYLPEACVLRASDSYLTSWNWLITMPRQLPLPGYRSRFLAIGRVMTTLRFLLCWMILALHIAKRNLICHLQSGRLGPRKMPKASSNSPDDSGKKRTSGRLGKVVRTTCGAPAFSLFLSIFFLASFTFAKQQPHTGRIAHGSPAPLNSERLYRSHPPPKYRCLETPAAQ